MLIRVNFCRTLRFHTLSISGKLYLDNKISTKNKSLLSETYLVKTFSARKDLFDILDIELEFTEGKTKGAIFVK